LSEAAPDVPEAFGHAVARAMAKDRADRPQSAGAFVDEVRASLGLPPHVRARGIHTTDADSVQTLDANRRGGGTHGTGLSAGATANLAHDTSALAGDGGTADTITDAFGAQGARASGHATSGNVGGRRGRGRETVAHSGGETRGNYATNYERDDAGGEYDTEGRGAGVSITAPEPKRSLAPLIAGGALALLLVAGVGGWFAWKGWGTQPAPSPASVTPEPPPPPVVPRVEAASYWFEAFDKAEDAAGRRVAEASVTLKSGQRFRFHFIPKARGYLYIIGPGEGGNAQVTLLTAQGAGPLKSNLVGGGADFAFPSIGGARLKLDDNPGADDFTFIFSPTPLMSPPFLTGKYLRELTPAEVKELEDFRAQHKADAPEVAVRGEGAERRVVVLAPEPATNAGKPLIYDVRVDHR
jgi:hypothetical protein